MANKAAVLYPYPAVQYIPLLVSEAAKGAWDPHPGLNRPGLCVGGNDQDWREFIKHAYGLCLPPLTLSSGEILLLALNIRLLDLKYRGNFVTVLAEPAPLSYQLWRCDRRLFYKDRIIFEVYTTEAEKLCWQAWEKPGQVR